MKHILLPVALCLLALAACSKKQESPTKDFLTCKIDSRPWEAKIVDPTLNFATMYLGQNMFKVSGMSNSGESVMVVLRDKSADNNSSGTFSLSAFGKLTWNSYGACFNHATNATYYTDSANGGTVIMTVNKTTKRVAGTFSFHATSYDSVTGITKELNVTEGKFACPYDEIH